MANKTKQKQNKYSSQQTTFSKNSGLLSQAFTSNDSQIKICHTSYIMPVNWLT